MANHVSSQGPLRAVCVLVTFTASPAAWSTSVLPQNSNPECESNCYRHVNPGSMDNCFSRCDSDYQKNSQEWTACYSACGSAYERCKERCDREGKYDQTLFTKPCECKVCDPATCCSEGKVRLEGSGVTAILKPIEAACEGACTIHRYRVHIAGKCDSKSKEVCCF